MDSPNLTTFLSFPRKALASHSADITFIANASTKGDGCNSASMDYFCNTQYPWLSLIIPKLQESNYSVEVVDWEEPDIDWSNKKCILLGPIWGYVAHIDHFLPWLANFDRLNVLHNSAAFIQWNVHKKYLLDLTRGEIPIPPTEFITNGSPFSFDEVILEAQKKFNHDDLIIKGCIDAAGYGYRRLMRSKATELRLHFEKLKSDHAGALIQAFIPEISAKGELSAVFFDNQFSHMFLKVAKHGEERVQPFYGGRSFHFNKFTVATVLDEIRSSFRPDLTAVANEIQSARKQIKHIYKNMLAVLSPLNIPDPLYVRIDGVIVKGIFIVMEIEGIEPYMEIQEAMQHDPTNDILGRYARAIQKILSSTQS